jgi:hypothetical protein
MIFSTDSTILRIIHLQALQLHKNQKTPICQIIAAYPLYCSGIASGYVIKLKTLLNALYFWRFFHRFFAIFFNKNALCCPSLFAHLRIVWKYQEFPLSTFYEHSVVM